jgi:broad specificity phosphatase PhoE
MSRRTIAAVTTILLARHGESDWNRALRWQGHADRPLTDRGRAQAEALAERLEAVELAAIYSSDLERARATACPVAERHGLDVITRVDLREVDVGSWSGLTRREVEAVEPEGVHRWAGGGKGWQGGESYEEMALRVVTAVGEIASEHPGRRVLVVSHGGSVRAVHAHALGMEFHAYRRSAPVEPNARLSAVVVENGRFSLEHLSDEPGLHSRQV